MTEHTQEFSNFVSHELFMLEILVQSIIEDTRIGSSRRSIPVFLENLENNQ